MVDTVLQFEGDRNHFYRILRSKKNRFGSTNEIGIYEMINSGLKEIINPSEILISNSKQKLSGSSIAAAIEGSRPFMIEVQALVSSAVYGTPQRSCTGFNSKRLNISTKLFPGVERLKTSRKIFLCLERLNISKQFFPGVERLNISNIANKFFLGLEK